jgi:hypothetical protein
MTIDFSDSNISNSAGVNISEMLDGWSGRLIFILENSGSPQLQSYSDETAGNMEFNENENEIIIPEKTPNPALYAAIWFVILLILITPAIMLWVKEIKRPKQLIFEQE